MQWAFSAPEIILPLCEPTDLMLHVTFSVPDHQTFGGQALKKPLKIYFVGASSRKAFVLGNVPGGVASNTRYTKTTVTHKPLRSGMSCENTQNKHSPFLLLDIQVKMTWFLNTFL